MPALVQASCMVPGFTQIELMMAVAITAVLAALAAPQLAPLVQRWRIHQAVQELQATLYLARAEAIQRGGNVFIEKLPAATWGCTMAATDRDWDCGWVVFADANGNKRWDAGEELQRFETPANLCVTRSIAKASISVDRWGMMDGANLIGFTVAPYPAGAASATPQGITMSAGGRIRISDKKDAPCTR